MKIYNILHSDFKLSPQESFLEFFVDIIALRLGYDVDKDLANRDPKAKEIRRKLIIEHYKKIINNAKQRKLVAGIPTTYYIGSDRTDYGYYDPDEIANITCTHITPNHAYTVLGYTDSAVLVVDPHLNTTTLEIPWEIFINKFEFFDD